MKNYEIEIKQSASGTKGISPLSIISNCKRLLDNSDGVSVGDKLGAIILAQTMVDTIQGQIDNLVEQLQGTPYDSIIDTLVKEGTIPEKGVVPVFTVIDRSGKRTTKALGTSVSNILDMGPFKALAEDPDKFRALPDEYKTVKLQDKSFFSKLYRADALGEYKKYFSLTSTTNTILKAPGAKKKGE